MASPKQVIALAGVGCMGKYACEELHADDKFDVVVISRSRQDWFTSRNIPVYESSYDAKSMQSILDETKATTLLSFISVDDQRFVTIHRAMIDACLASKSCKRFMPSEFSGNIDDFPNRPRFYASTRGPIREILRKHAPGLEYTLLECGWYMDYFLRPEKSYMRPVPEEFPINLSAWTAKIRGTGNELESWTLGRDVGKAVVALCAAKDWEDTTYVCGQWGSFNEAVKLMEDFYKRPMKEITYIPAEEIRAFVQANLHNEDDYKVRAVMCDEFSIDGATACPKEKTLRQRETFFKDVKFHNVREVLQMGEDKAFL